MDSFCFSSKHMNGNALTKADITKHIDQKNNITSNFSEIDLNEYNSAVQTDIP